MASRDAGQPGSGAPEGSNHWANRSVGLDGVAARVSVHTATRSPYVADTSCKWSTVAEVVSATPSGSHAGSGVPSSSSRRATIERPPPKRGPDSSQTTKGGPVNAFAPARRGAAEASGRDSNADPVAGQPGATEPSGSRRCAYTSLPPERASVQTTSTLPSKRRATSGPVCAAPVGAMSSPAGPH